MGFLLAAKRMGAEPNHEQMGKAIMVRFDSGTLLLDGLGARDVAPTPFSWAPRVARWRAPAAAYRTAITELHRRKIAYVDRARRYDEFQFVHRSVAEPRPYQREAIEAWKRAGRRGVIVLPTGAGKSLVAEMAIAEANRSTLIVVPTIDLMNQWYDILSASFEAEIGLIGGGYFELGAITISTYASAFRHMEKLGDRFGLLVFDECHHLPGSSYRHAAEMAIAPFRLGLTATPERADGAERLLADLIGPIVFRRKVADLAGAYLADYQLVKVHVELSAEERAQYEKARSIFRAFIESERIPLGNVEGWHLFIAASARSERGRRAMLAYREAKRIALGTDAKLRALTQLLARHRDDRVLIFTAENEMVYRISELFLVPVITHETPIKERRFWLEAFNRGDVKAIATSKVLNEGVNIPDASVAIVLSGSGSSREHIQRLGRILRPRPGKRAVLYELVTRDTTEEGISRRRSDQQADRERDPMAPWLW